MAETSEESQKNTWDVINIIAKHYQKLEDKKEILTTTTTTQPTRKDLILK
jgi:hypothetical protein